MIALRSILASGCLWLLLAYPAGISGAGSPALAAPPAGAEVADLIRRSEQSNAALMRGDIDAYRALITLSDDFTLMSPFGGAPTHGASMTEAQWRAMGRFFRSGTLRQDVIRAYRSPDMVVLATIERAQVEVGGLPPQLWALRVTLVYRREGSEWRLAHRHADPLVAGIGLDQAAALARGSAIPG